MTTTIRIALRTATLLFFFTVLLCASAHAQGGRKRSKVVVYDETKPFRFDTISAVKNVFKLNPLVFLTGEIPLYYERALSPQISFELALGMTFRNYISLKFNNEADDFGGGIEILPQASFHFAIRYYFEANVELEGFYISPELSYRNYSKNISEKNDDGSFSERTNLDERKFNDIKILIGYQSLSHSNNWLLDFYTGLGARVRDLQIVEETNTLGDGWTYKIAEVSDVVPAFYIGVKVGLGF